MPFNKCKNSWIGSDSGFSGIGFIGIGFFIDFPGFEFAANVDDDAQGVDGGARRANVILFVGIGVVGAPEPFRNALFGQVEPAVVSGEAFG